MKKNSSEYRLWKKKNDEKKFESPMKALLANSRNTIGNQKSFLDRTVKIRVKKPKHGPQGRTKPLFNQLDNLYINC